MKNIVTIVLLLAGCGQEAAQTLPSGTPTDTSSTTSTSVKKQGPDDQTSVGTNEADQSPEMVPIQLLLAGMTLPTCSIESLGQTFYVMDERGFKYCDGASWTVIDLRGKDGAPGKDGVPGATSGTDVAGTTKGEKGDAGPAGPTGPQGLQGLQGPVGATGSPGPAGPQGLQGATGAVGPVGPQGPKGDKGDQGIAGPQGVAGNTGATGSQGAQGPAGPAGPQGLQGPAGTNGATWFSGSGAPASGTGSDADHYLDTATGNVYLKTSGLWGSPIGNLRGPQGVTGATGATGPQGPAGASGATGPQGPAGAPGTNATISTTVHCDFQASGANNFWNIVDATYNDATFWAQSANFVLQDLQWLTYDMSIMANGDVWASASLYNNGAKTKSSSASIYAPQSKTMAPTGMNGPGHGSAYGTIIIRNDWTNQTTAASYGPFVWAIGFNPANSKLYVTVGRLALTGSNHWINWSWSNVCTVTNY